MVVWINYLEQILYILQQSIQTHLKIVWWICHFWKERRTLDGPAKYNVDTLSVL